MVDQRCFFNNTYADSFKAGWLGYYENANLLYDANTV